MSARGVLSTVSIPDTMTRLLRPRLPLLFITLLALAACDRHAPIDSAQAAEAVSIDGGAWVPCASERGTCAFSGSRRVMYGTAAQHTVKTFRDEAHCDNGSFDDPAPGAEKTCWYEADKGASVAPAAKRAVATRIEPKPADTPPMQCSAPGAPVPASQDGDAIEADTPGSDGTRMFALDAPIRVAITTRASSADTVAWQIRAEWNTVKASGQFPVAAKAQTYTLACTSGAAGYFAVSATLTAQKSALSARGTRPTGIATFGVLSNVTVALPAVNFAHPDQHRFGGQGVAYLKLGETCCSGDGYRPLYPALGLTWVNDNRNWYMSEEKAPNQFNPSADHLQSFFKHEGLLRLIQLDGIPAWASPNKKQTHSYTPAMMEAYRDYMKRVGEESNAVRKKWFPQQTANYYQVTWEPDYEGGLPWKDSDANLVAMYKATHEPIHATDPNAVVMGLTLSNLASNATWLKRLAPLGIGKYLDGVSAHGYYDVGTSPSHPPERFDADPSTAFKSMPGAKLFVTETSVSYDIGSKYRPNSPNWNVLYAQGAVVVRAHLILLGEGADVSFVFYSADFPGEIGYGVFFDLVNAQGGFGLNAISPKPAAMSVAAMTRMIDGTMTLGHVNGTPRGVYAYAFQRLNNGKIVTALWTHDNAVWPGPKGFDPAHAVNYTLTVNDVGKSGTVTVFDMMGNASNVKYEDGRVALTLTEAPLYVVSDNTATMRANVTKPVGYTGQ
ncbi:serine/threonine protein kinase [Candidatus Burkholderia humilis]|nr:serine/threonine protein kinase [Candidatus Burkholderia humilis]